MDKTILITGGSGLIGKPLIRMLLKKGYKIHNLSRNNEQHGNPNIKVFKWDVYKREIDENCLSNVEAIVHLTGEGIAEKPWTKKRKEQIIESRTESIRMIYGLLKKNKDHQVKSVISASAIGYYSNRGDDLMTEENKPGTDFLAHSCVEWEKAVDEGEALGLRVVKLRTGVVLEEGGGALPQLAIPIKLGFGAALGSGKQWVSWVHIRDVVKMYVFALENELAKGAYNMAAPHPVTNKQLTQAIAKKLQKPLWLPNMPAFALRVVLGEMSTVVLDSVKVSSDKIQSEGFGFEFPTIQKALEEIYN